MTKTTLKDVKIFSGNGNSALAQRVCDYLKVPLNQALVSKFADGESRVKILENIRGDDVFLIQSTCPPVNDNYMETFIMLDAFRRASAHHVTVVMPYMGYSRQDKKVKPREPITSRVMANLIETMGAVRLISVDLHAEQIQGFFNIPVDNLYGGPIIGRYYQSLGYQDKKNICVVSPDVSGVERARNLAVALGDATLAIIAKRRPEPNKSAIIDVIGDVSGKQCIILDDMADTCGTLLNGANALMARGASGVEAACSHAILSKDAVDKINNSILTKFVCLDTIPHITEHLPSCAVVLSVAPLLGEAISRCHTHESVSELKIGDISFLNFLEATAGMNMNDDILVKIYLEDGKIVFEALSTEVVEGKLYPTGGSRIGTVCCGSNKHVCVTKQALEPLKKLLQATTKNRDCMGDIDMWRTTDNQCCFAWVGPVKRVFTIGGHNQTARDTKWEFDQFVVLDD